MQSVHMLILCSLQTGVEHSHISNVSCNLGEFYPWDFFKCHIQAYTSSFSGVTC